jgi:pyrroline-5-carboxylate reductase
MRNVAVLGAGKMGEALLSGLVKSGHPTDRLCFTERHDDRAREVTERLGVRRVDVPGAAAVADTVVVAVKPQDIGELLTALEPVIRAGTLVLSICAGLPTELYERRLPEGTAVVRAMPNTPMLVGEAMSAISPGRHATEEHLDEVTGMLAAVGRVVRVPESQQDNVTALSGSGPAYFFYMVEAMVEAGVLLGVSRQLATELIVQSAFGAARMLRETGEHPAVLREGVTSPAGTTAMALRELEQHRTRAAITAALEAARDRSIELGKLNSR